MRSGPGRTLQSHLKRSTFASMSYCHSSSLKCLIEINIIVYPSMIESVPNTYYITGMNIGKRDLRLILSSTL